MTPLLKKHDYQSRPLFNPAPGSMHIIDLIHSEQHYTSRTSDHVTGLLILASNMTKISKVQACWFQVPFTIGVKLRTSLYEHEGHACLGPDGKAMRLGNSTFGGGDKVEAGAYSLTDIEGLERAPNFDTWLQGMLWRGEEEGSAKSDFALAGAEPPRRNKDGAIVPKPPASVKQNSRKRRSSSSNTNPAKKSKLAAKERGQTLTTSAMGSGPREEVAKGAPANDAPARPEEPRANSFSRWAFQTLRSSAPWRIQ